MLLNSVCEGMAYRGDIQITTNSIIILLKGTERKLCNKVKRKKKNNRKHFNFFGRTTISKLYSSRVRTLKNGNKLKLSIVDLFSFASISNEIT